MVYQAVCLASDYQSNSWRFILFSDGFENTFIKEIWVKLILHLILTLLIVLMTTATARLLSIQVTVYVAHKPLILARKSITFL